MSSTGDYLNVLYLLPAGIEMRLGSIQDTAEFRGSLVLLRVGLLQT